MLLKFYASATLTGLTSAVAYEYHLTDGEIEVAKGEFTTEDMISLQNGSLDDWSTSDKVPFPNVDASTQTFGIRVTRVLVQEV